MHRLLLIFLGLGVVPGLSAGENVYRWVDAEGNVTYSSRAPAGAADVREIEIDPGPTEEQREQAEARLQRSLESIEETEEARNEAMQQRREQAREAEEALTQAEQNLQEAKRVRPSDWILGYRTSGMRKPEYYERVKEAEAAVEEARHRLKKIR